MNWRSAGKSDLTLTFRPTLWSQEPFACWGTCLLKFQHAFGKLSFEEPLLKAPAHICAERANSYLFSVCLRGTKAHKKCYLMSEGTKHFHEANEDCIAKGGTLAIPRNNEETNILRDYGKKSAPPSVRVLAGCHWHGQWGEVCWCQWHGSAVLQLGPCPAQRGQAWKLCLSVSVIPRQVGGWSLPHCQEIHLWIPDPIITYTKDHGHVLGYQHTVLLSNPSHIESGKLKVSLSCIELTLYWNTSFLC